MNLCLIFNFAPQYRESIYRLIDETYDCSWYFGNNDTDIEGMDLSQLRHATLVKNQRLHGHWYWQKGVLSLLHEHNAFLMLGELYCLSTWVFTFLAMFYPNKKVYFWTHGWYGKETKLKCLLKKIFFRMANGIFLYGNYAKGLMIKEGFNADKLFVIHNSLSYDKQIQLRQTMQPSDIYYQHFGNKNKTLVFIGRLTAVKRIDMLIKAVSELKRRGENYNIVLVGDGKIRTDLERLAEEKKVNVWFYGACYDEAENAKLIYNADLCVAPGNVGLTAMHSMVFGTPVLTHNCFKYQMPEFEAIIKGKTGTFFEYENVMSLADAITHWFTKYATDRDIVRKACYEEIDSSWNPQYQLKIIKSVFDISYNTQHT